MEVENDKDNKDVLGVHSIETEDINVRIRFITDVSKYRVPETSIAVPTNLAQEGLSEVINHLLGHEAPISFDFEHLETQRLVRNTLTTFIRTNQLSTEDVLVLKFSPSKPEPKDKTNAIQPDWVSCLDGTCQFNQKSSTVCSGCYDGSMSLYELSCDGDLSLLDKVTSAHNQAVKSVAQVNQNGNFHFVSAGKDGLVKFWRMNEDNKITQSAVCKGHTDSVESVCARILENSLLAVSGGWDSVIYCWKTNISELENGIVETDEIRKKRRMELDDSMPSQKSLVPYLQFTEHKDKVSAVAWADPNNPVVVWSGSWDHSIRSWDLFRESQVVTMNGTKVVTSLSSQIESQLIASGHADHVVRLWDAKTGGDSVVKLELKSHDKWVSGVAWSQKDKNILLTSSFDRTIHVWDIRSSLPLFTIPKHEDKILCIGWNHDWTQIISGGADCNLSVSAMDSE